MTFTIDDLIAAIDKAKAAGEVTGSSPVTILNYEGDSRSFVTLAKEVTVAPAGDIPEASLMLAFE